MAVLDASLPLMSKTSRKIYRIVSLGSWESSSVKQEKGQENLVPTSTHTAIHINAGCLHCLIR